MSRSTVALPAPGKCALGGKIASWADTKNCRVGSISREHQQGLGSPGRVCRLLSQRRMEAKQVASSKEGLKFRTHRKACWSKARCDMVQNQEQGWDPLGPPDEESRRQSGCCAAG